MSLVTQLSKRAPERLDLVRVSRELWNTGQVLSAILVTVVSISKANDTDKY